MAHTSALRKLAPLPLLLVIAACTASSNDGERTTSAAVFNRSTSKPKLSMLVTVQDEPPGAHCAAGGQAILSGYDVDGDGVLDPTEVTSVKYVCNGVSGTSALVRQSSEPAGANCANGGTKIDSGQDTNADGVLEDSEVTSTSYVCNGTDGAPGTLTRTTTIPPGATCTYGGSLVEVGTDASGDGVLEPSEIFWSVTICVLRTGAAIGPGVTCPYGGTHFDYGHDDNLDGVLEPSEIERSEDVCNGCGTLGSPCCTSGPACAGSGLACDTRYGVCTACGALGGPCCGTDQTCRCSDAWTQCGGLGGSYTTCATCGGPGEPCCRPYPPHSACGATGNCRTGLTCTAFGTCQ